MTAGNLRDQIPNGAPVGHPAGAVEYSQRFPNHCFTVDQRLHKPAEFASTLAARKVIRGKTFDLHFRLDGPVALARLGLIVPKRLARKASLRNSIKRQGREAFRLAARDLPPVDIVLRLTQPVKHITARDAEHKRMWRQEMDVLLHRLMERSG